MRYGFTIVELLIAAGLFAMLTAIAVGGFVNVIHTQRLVTAQLIAASNANLALEQIARELRTGYDFKCRRPASCVDSTDLELKNALGQSIEYRYDDRNKTIERSDDDGRNFERITGTNLAINRLFFWVVAGSGGSDGYPPRILIMIQATPSTTTPGELPTILLQTTVSSRVLDG